MPFLPATSLLNTVNELDVINHVITYTDELSISYPVVVTTTQPNGTVLLSGNTISGYYSNVFSTTIDYRTKQDTFVQVYSWNDIVNSELYGIYHYHADPTIRRTYTYTATAYNEGTILATTTYTINVDNDWDYGKEQLLNYVYTPGTGINWINNSSQIVTWTNTFGAIITWTQ